MSDQNLLNRIRANYQLATAELTLHPHHASAHWQKMNKEFNEFFARPEMWQDFRSNAISRGLDDANPHDTLGLPENLQQFLAQAVHDLSVIIDADFLSLLEESSVGSPRTFTIQGMNCTMASLDYLCFAWQIFQSVEQNRELPLLFLEIGGGFGGLIRVLKAVFPKARFIAVDLPEGNALTTYFLQKNFPESNIFTLTDLRQGSMLDWQLNDFAVLPGWCLESVADGIIDYTINTRSMMEMNRETINWYLGQLQRLCKVGGLFYCVNRYYKKIGEESIILADYPYDANWDFLYSQPKPFQSHIHQLISRRRPDPNPQYPHPALLALPRP